MTDTIETKTFILRPDTDINPVLCHLADNGAFGIKLYYYSDEIIYMIKSLLDETLKIVEKNELRNMIYNGVKEIVINGIKANLKRVVFKQNQLDLDNLDHYTYGMNLFRDFLSAHTPEEIEKTLIKNGYELVILCAKVDNGLRIEVMNNCELCSIEEARIRERFRLAMQYKDLVSFMDDHSNHIEGSGLGIFLLILMLREHGIDPSYFRVGKKYQGYTVSRIEIPFNKDFLGIRED